jgi:hypothetical protein
MRFRIIYYSILCLLWLIAGAVLFYVGTYGEARGESFRYASYLAFLMVLWNLLRVLQAWQRSKKSDESSR